VRRFLGYGVGLRRAHFDDLFDSHAGVDCLEILSENFMAFGGRARAVLERAARQFPLVLHGVGLSIGSVAPLSATYLARLGETIARYRPALFSDHLCYSSAFGVEYHDLIPLPFTAEAVAHVAARARQVQAIAPDTPFLLENPSYYVAFAGAEMTELEFVCAVLEAADCGMLLDVNNVYVNARNHGYDPRAFIDGLPAHRIQQLHLAGHTPRGDLLIDTHGDHVADPVFELYAHTLARLGPVTTILEWDNQVPTLEVLLEENCKIRAVGEGVLGRREPWRP
jgi:hypothetical protein